MEAKKFASKIFKGYLSEKGENVSLSDLDNSLGLFI